MNTSNVSLWEDIKAVYRHACDLERAGDPAAASQTIRDELAPRFAQWSRETGCGSENKKLFVDNLMRQERRRVESEWVRHHLESRQRRTDLETAIKSERAEIQREWAVQGSVGQNLAELTLGAPPVRQPRSARSVIRKPIPPAEVNSPPFQPRPVTVASPILPETSTRIPIDDLPNIIDFVLEQQQRAHEPTSAPGSRKLAVA
ncbi:MAG: hypothetical protein ACJASX_003978 [Limisphaerales bacterium]|jgi:hypothetical protein